MEKLSALERFSYLKNQNNKLQRLTVLVKVLDFYFLIPKIVEQIMINIQLLSKKYLYTASSLAR